MEGEKPESNGIRERRETLHFLKISNDCMKCPLPLTLEPVTDVKAFAFKAVTGSEGEGVLYTGIVVPEET